MKNTFCGFSTLLLALALIGCGGSSSSGSSGSGGSTSGGFSLSESATALSIGQGFAATDTISVTYIESFSGRVTLTVSGLPNGVTPTFATNPTSDTSALTLVVAPDAPGGTSTLTVSGASGSVTASTTISLTIVSAGSFSLSPSSSTLTVPQGNSKTDTITVTDVSPFNGAVSLYASGLPDGVTVTFGTNPTTGSSDATFTASDSATIGAFTVTIIGTSGQLTATTTIALSVVAHAFTLAPEASSIFVQQGASNNNTIAASDISPFKGDVTLRHRDYQVVSAQLLDPTLRPLSMASRLQLQAR